MREPGRGGDRGRHDHVQAAVWNGLELSGEGAHPRSVARSHDGHAALSGARPQARLGARPAPKLREQEPRACGRGRLAEAAELIERWREVEAECSPEAFRSSLASLAHRDRACLAWCRGDRERSLDWLERLTDERNKPSDLQLRHAALRRLGVLRQDAHSARRVDAAAAFFGERGVVDPERYAGSITGIFDLPPG